MATCSDVNDYEFSVRFYEFKMADRIWLLCGMVAMVFIETIVKTIIKFIGIFNFKFYLLNFKF